MTVSTVLSSKVSSSSKRLWMTDAWLDGHIIEWDQVEILDTAKDLNERKVKEALYIKLAPQGCRINRDEGKELSPLWLNAIKRSRQRSRGSAHKEMDSQERSLRTTVTAMYQHHPPISEDRRPPSGVQRHTRTPRLAPIDPVGRTPPP